MGRVGLALSLALGLASPAPAQETEGGLPLELDLAECPELDAELVARLLRIELSLELEEREGSADDVTRVAARCGEDGIAELIVDDPTTGKTTSRRVRLDARGSERLLGLAAAEVVAASWAEHHLRPTAPEVERVDQTASRETVAAATEAVAPRVFRPLPPPEFEEPPRWIFGSVFLSAGVSGRPGHATAGLGFQVGLALNEWLAAHFDLTYDVGRTSTERGAVTLRRFSAGLALTLRTRLGPWVPFGGAGLRAGFAFLEADRSVSGRIGGPILLGGLTVGDGPAMGVGWVELGWHTWSQRGTVGAGPGAAEVAGKDGPWVAVQVGVAARL